MQSAVEDLVPVASEIKKVPWTGWGIKADQNITSLNDVMSEELVNHLTTKEIEPIELVDEEILLPTEDDATSSDLLLANMLQMQFDIEHDELLRKQQEKINGTNKVAILFDQFRAVHPSLQSDVDFNEDYLNVVEAKVKKDTLPKFGKSGIIGKGKNIVTKHDANICGKRNVNKVMDQFCPEFETGDDGTFDMRLPNRVYNHLKEHSHLDAKRSHRLHDKKEHATKISAIDEKTRLLMFKMVNNASLASINGVISTGKESVVFHADGGILPDNAFMPKECALKVFKTTLAEFKNRSIYVKGDLRFFKDEFKKQNPRKIMRIWAEKEELNLKRMQKFKISCPVPVLRRKHILVLSFIGEDQVAAPKLANATLTEAECQLAYDQCIQMMKDMYTKCKFVHADLSEYNMLWWKDQLYLIDVAQTVEIVHPKAMHFLLRDCRNVTQFFKKKGVHNVMKQHELFNMLTGLSLSNHQEEFLEQIQKMEKNEALMRLEDSKTDYPFDYFFNQSVGQRQLPFPTKSDAIFDRDNNDNNSDNDDDDDSCEDNREISAIHSLNHSENLDCDDYSKIESSDDDDDSSEVDDDNADNANFHQINNCPDKLVDNMSIKNS